MEDARAAAPTCRPALNYYLLCAWPGEYVDDSQSRFINERVHANIQKDGTYSVVPRMWGGLTSAKELRAIADVVDKFDIPTVKVTGGQRIDLLGVKKEDLPAVWADLNAAGMVSGHAYAKGLRTVKTCVGTDWCRFGTQDSTGLGVKLEKFMWGSWTPAKVKMAVSGCPRNCAEATCKDIGVICVDSRLRHPFRRRRRPDIKGTELLGHVATEDEAIETIARPHPALSRAGPLSRAHLQVGRARRAGDHPRSRSWTTTSAAARSTTASCIPSNSPRSTPGPSAPPARTRTSSRRSPTSRLPRWPRNERDRQPLDRRRRDRRHSRARLRASCARRAARSPCSAPPSDEVFALENRCPHKGGPLSQGIVHGRKVTCPLHNWVINLEDGEATGADKGCARRFPVRLEKGRVYLDIERGNGAVTPSQSAKPTRERS